MLTRPHLTVSLARLAAPVLALTCGLAGTAPGFTSAVEDFRRGWTTYASGDEILALALDPRDSNILWAGTDGGGVVHWRLDERAFEQFLFPQTEGLLSNQIRDLAISPVGELWAATRLGVTRFDGRRWQTWRSPDIPSDDVTAVAPAGTEVWIGTRARGLARWNGRLWTTFSAESDGPQGGPASNQVADLAVDANGQVWVVHGRGHDTGIAASVLTTGGQWQHVRALPPGVADHTGPRRDHIVGVTAAPDGRLWFATWGDGVYSFDGARWERYTDFGGGCSPNIYAVVTAGKYVWAACAPEVRAAGKGAARFDGTRWSTLDRDDGLPTDSIVAIAADARGAWLGTNDALQGGFGIVPVTDRPHEPLSTHGRTLPGADVSAVAADADAGVWVGTRGRGLAHLDADRWTVFTVDNTDGGLAGDTITAVLIHAGRVWVGSARTQFDRQTMAYRDGGLSSFDLKAGTWQTYRPGQSGLPSVDVSALAMDDDGTLWIGTGVTDLGRVENMYQGAGLVSFDAVGGRWTVHNHASTRGGLAGDTVTGLALEQISTSSRALWVSAAYFVDPSSDGRKAGGGVSRFDGRNWQRWDAVRGGLDSWSGGGQPDALDGLITADVRAIAVDLDARVWSGGWNYRGDFGSAWPYVDAVVNRMDGRWSSFGFKGDGWISSLIQDAVGRIWAGTSRGYAEADYVPGIGAGDRALGGVWLWQGVGWARLAPPEVGLAGRSIAAMATARGDVWVASHEGGLSHWRAGGALPSPVSTDYARPAVPTLLPGAAAQPAGGVSPGALPNRRTVGLAALALVGAFVTVTALGLARRGRRATLP